MLHSKVAAYAVDKTPSTDYYLLHTSNDEPFGVVRSGIERSIRKGYRRRNVHEGVIPRIGYRTFLVQTRTTVL